MSRRPPAPPPDLPGYDYVRVLGSGGFADVHLYEQRLPRRRVAVKVLISGELDREAGSRFVAEANLTARLSAYPSIVTILHADVSADGRPYLVMEYCSGPSLAERYKRERFGIEEALRIGVRLSGAVATAHAGGILHRDIKPANVLTTEFGWPALTDFGIASALEEESPVATTTTDLRRAAHESGSHTGDGASVGMSVPWSPPEMFDDDPKPDVQSDVFSLAATLATLLAGRSPFEVPGRGNGTIDLISRIERGQITPLGREDAPRSLVAVLARGMASKRADRFRSAVDFARALQRVELELGYTPTALDVPQLLVARPEPGGSSDDETRLRQVATIRAQAEAPIPVDAERTRDSTPTDEHPVDSTPLDDSTALRPARDHTSPPTEAPGPVADTRRGPSRRAIIASVTVVVVLIVVIGSGVLISSLVGGTGRGGPGGDSTPGITIEVVPKPVAVSATRSADGTSATFRWSNPAPRSGDRFEWVRKGGNPDPHNTATTTATVMNVTPGAAVCLDVHIVRNGRSSADPLEMCT